MFWIENIPVKNINPFKLNERIQVILNSITHLTSIFVFDIEFQTYMNEKHLLEMGGILLIKKDNEWYYYGNFHFNCPPVSNIHKLNVIQSDYINVSKETEKEIIDIETNYLFYKTLEKYRSNEQIFYKYYKKIKSSPIIKKRNLNLDMIKNNPDKIIKKLKDVSFTLKKKDIGNDTFNKLWKLYLKDKYVKQRMFIPNKSWLKSFYETLTSSLLMVKGNMDLVAIDNLLKKYKLPILPKTIIVYDIAFFNDIFRKLCQSAKLENTYNCIIEKNLLDPELNSDLKQIFKSLVLIDKKLIAHNPLVDSFYTLIVGITMYDNIKKISNK